MKFYKNLFIMLGVLICLTGYYLYLENPNVYVDVWNNWTEFFKTVGKENKEPIGNDNDPIVEHSEPVGVFDRTKAVKFIVSNTSNSFTIEKKSNKWTIDGMSIEQNELDIAVQCLLNLASLNLIEVSPTDFAKYGLVNTSASVMVVIEDGTNFEYHLGNQNASTGEYYVKVRDANKIFKVSEDTGKEFLRKLSLKKVFDFSANDVVRYTVNVVNGSGRNRFVKDNELWNRISTDEVFNPLDKQAEFVDKIKNFASLTMTSYVGINLNYADLEAYGLINPEYIIAFNGTGIPQTTMDIGKTVDGNVYVELNGEVFTVSENIMKILLKIDY